MNIKPLLLATLASLSGLAAHAASCNVTTPGAATCAIPAGVTSVNVVATGGGSGGNTNCTISGVTLTAAAVGSCVVTASVSVTVNPGVTSYSAPSATGTGTIVDQGGPGLQGASSIPTLSEWGMILLAGMLGCSGWG